MNKIFLLLLLLLPLRLLNKVGILSEHIDGEPEVCSAIYRLGNFQ